MSNNVNENETNYQVIAQAISDAVNSLTNINGAKSLVKPIIFEALSVHIALRDLFEKQLEVLEDIRNELYALNNKPREEPRGRGRPPKPKAEEVPVKSEGQNVAAK